jgi:S1-C subfamily serine protease
MIVTARLEPPLGAVLRDTKIGCCVERTVPGLPAAHTFCPGDVIVTVNNEYVLGDTVERVRARFKKANSAPVRVSVWRFSSIQPSVVLDPPLRRRAASWPFVSH